MTDTPPAVIHLPLVGGRRAVPVELLPGPATVLDLLPAARRVAGEAVADAITGKDISCKAGCGACCRQLVAISLPEAVALGDLVAAMPPERQAVVRGRFVDAARRLEEARLLDPAAPRGRSLIGPAGDPTTAVRAVAEKYFALGLACPFLEDESCSIHPDRPMVCREYHVTSPAERCGHLYQEPVDRVDPAVRVGPALAAVAHRLGGLPMAQVPLSLALEWAEAVGPAVHEPHDAAELAAAFASAVEADADRRALVQADEVTASIELNVGGRRVALEVTVPTAPTSARVALPLARAVADVAVRAAGDRAAAEGTPLSCGPGCAACCRELIAVAEPEAYHLAAVVAAMPEPRRGVVRERFAAAARRAAEGGLLDAVRSGAAGGPDRPHVSALYFALRIDCPFLEGEACSAYDERPLVCRQHVVTSPAAECWRPHDGQVRKVSLPVSSPFWTLAAVAAGRAEGDPVPWVPLVFALAWAAAHPEPPPSQTGPEWVSALMRSLTGAGGGHAG